MKLLLKSKAVAQVSAALSGTLGLLSGMAWMLGHWRLTTFSPLDVPVAPLTGWSLVLLSAALGAWCLRPSGKVIRILAITAGLVVGLFALWVLFEVQAGGQGIRLEQWLSASQERVGGALIGRMSPLTAIGLFLGSTALLLILATKTPGPLYGALALGCSAAVVLLGAVTVAGYGIGAPLLYQGQQIPVALATGMALTALGVALICAVQTRGSWTCELPSLGLVAALLIVLVLMLGAGSWFYKTQQQSAKQNAEANLLAIVSSKAAQIQQWRQERLADGGLFSESPFLTEAAANYLARPEAELKTNLLAHFRASAKYQHYEDVTLVDRGAQACLSLSGHASSFHEQARQALSAALASGQPELSNLHEGPGNLAAHLDVVAPLAVQGPSNLLASAAILLRCNAGDFLYPLLQSWPVPSPTAETLLIHREGDQVVFLNDLRHRPQAALRLKLPLSQTNVAAVQAALGRHGAFEAADYRAERVLAAAAPIPGSDWVLVAKLDTREAFAAWHFRSVLILILIFGFVFAAAVITALVWQRKTRFYRYARSLLEANLDPLVAISPEGKITDANIATEKATGCTRSELIGTDFSDYFTQPEKARLGYQQVFREGAVRDYALELRDREGKVRSVLYNAAVYRDGGARVAGVFAAARDITERRQAELALKHSEARYRCLVQATAQIDWTTDAAGYVRQDMPRWREFTGLTLDQIQEDRWLKSVHPDDRARVARVWQRAVVDKSFYEVEYRIRRQDGVYRDFWVRGVPVLAEDGAIREWVGSCTDISERKQGELELRSNQERLALAQQSARIGSFEWDIRTGKNIWSPELESLYGLATGTFEGTFEAWAQRVHPQDLPKANEDLQRSLKEGQFVSEWRAVWPDRSPHWLHARARVFFDRQGQPERMVGINMDITEQKRAEEELRRQTEELRRSNEELERFAYVASHDLQEPLRTVGSFSQLLAQRYQGRLGEDADEFINFIVEGAKRMQSLINDLLTYSRIGTRGHAFVPIQSEESLGLALENLGTSIAESGAVITHDPLPKVVADPAQLTQVFQNLLSNAIKFRRASVPPKIHLSAVREVPDWNFSVQDNGMGIDPQFFDRIFVIFQRLHGREEYPGTGIGLAVCKRIVERHGGRIWVDSAPGKGSIFHFTVPAEPKTYDEQRATPAPH